MKALITGGAGFIGLHLVSRLKREGWQVVIVDRKNGIDTASSQFKELFQKERPDVVFHLAGPIRLRKSKPESAFNDCMLIFEGTKNLLETAHSVGVKKFIFSSSGGAYEGAKEIPTPETYSTGSSSLYGLMSLLIEKLIMDYQSTISQTPTAILRLSNVYGPGQWKNVIQLFTEAIQRNESPKIDGDGSSTRDYIYVDDVVDAFWMVANSNATGVFNIGTSKETSLKTLFEHIAGTLGWDKELQYVTATRLAVSRNALDCAKAKKEFEWQATTSLAEGLRKTLKI